MTTMQELIRTELHAGHVVLDMNGIALDEADADEDAEPLLGYAQEGVCVDTHMDGWTEDAPKPLPTTALPEDFEDYRLVAVIGPEFSDWPTYWVFALNE
jgi:hypothetical protein